MGWFIYAVFHHWLLNIGGAVLAFYAYLRKEKLKKYEFEHRSGGGTVGFESYGAAKAHSWKFAFFSILFVFGLSMIFIGMFWSVSGPY